MKKHEKEIIKRFGFNDLDDFYRFRQDFNPKWFVDEDEAFYTDGDEGTAVLRLSEVFDEGGLSVRLIDCCYCDFDMRHLKKIQNRLIETREMLCDMEEMED